MRKRRRKCGGKDGEQEIRQNSTRTTAAEEVKCDNQRSDISDADIDPQEVTKILFERVHELKQNRHHFEIIFSWYDCVLTFQRNVCCGFDVDVLGIISQIREVVLENNRQRR